MHREIAEKTYSGGFSFPTVPKHIWMRALSCDLTDHIKFDGQNTDTVKYTRARYMEHSPTQFQVFFRNVRLQLKN